LINALTDSSNMTTVFEKEASFNVDTEIEGLVTPMGIFTTSRRHESLGHRAR